MKGKKIVMCGNHEAGYEIIIYLLKNGIKFDYFVLLPKVYEEKYAISGFIDFSPLAKKYNIPVYYVNSFSLTDNKDIEFFIKNKFDLLIQGGWQRLFPDNILKTLSIGSIGVHGSSDFLPRGRGRSPLNWSLIEGKKRFIMHLFLMKDGADDGDVFDFEQFDINIFDNINTLYMKNALVTRRMLLRSIPKLIDGTLKIFKQKGEASYYKKRNLNDGKINWLSEDIDQIYNLIRATTKPYPGSFTYINGVKVYIWEAQIFDRSIKYKDAEYGEVVEIFSENKIIVNCLGGLLLITKFDTKKNIQCGDIMSQIAKKVSK